MKILVAHNYYGDFAQGGEAIVFEQEVALLRRFGHDVVTYVRANSEIDKLPWRRRITVPLRFAGDREVYEHTRATLESFCPDVVHVHNYKYLITPAIFQAARDANVPTVLTLHNYRLLAPCGQLRRGQTLCQECMTSRPERALWRKGCAASVQGRVLQYLFYRATRRQVVQNVDAFIALTLFARELFIQGGLPQRRVYYKPNFLPQLETGIQEANDRVHKDETLGAIFVGRLAPEKGVRFLVNAWRKIDYPLTIVGDGPERDWLASVLPNVPQVRWLGAREHSETLQLIARANFLVFPSVWYECAPMTLLEALRAGTPVVTSDLGGRREIVTHEKSGLLYNANDTASFCRAVERIIADGELRASLSRGALEKFRSEFTHERNYDMLMAIYRDAQENSRARLGKGANFQGDAL
ncbi:MAG: glycosyltransferase family 4 protein [Planctomycetia bacterium]|nr:glycosyltransferase family 4 protein [Planctomycetia bacterium]